MTGRERRYLFRRNKRKRYIKKKKNTKERFSKKVLRNAVDRERIRQKYGKSIVSMTEWKKKRKNRKNTQTRDGVDAGRGYVRTRNTTQAIRLPVAHTSDMYRYSAATATG